MKKTKILLPMLSVGAIASTGAAMAITSCASTIELNEVLEAGTTKQETVICKQNVSLTANKWYTAKVNVKIYTKEIDTTDFWAFTIPDGLDHKDQTVTAEITDAEVTIDGNKLKKIEASGQKMPEKDEFVIYESENNWMIRGGQKIVKKDSKVQIKFKIANDVKDFVLCFGFFKQHK